MNRIIAYVLLTASMTTPINDFQISTYVSISKFTMAPMVGYRPLSVVIQVRKMCHYHILTMEQRHVTALRIKYNIGIESADTPYYLYSSFKTFSF